MQQYRKWKSTKIVVNDPKSIRPMIRTPQSYKALFSALGASADQVKPEK